MGTNSDTNTEITEKFSPLVLSGRCVGAGLFENESNVLQRKAEMTLSTQI